MTLTTDPDSNKTSDTYDPSDNLTTQEIETSGGTEVSSVTNAYDSENQLVESTDGSIVTSYAYDAEGNRTLVAVGSDKTTYAYDGDGQPTKITDPDLNVTQLTYDADGNILTSVTENSTGVAYSAVSAYDHDNRLTQQTVGGTNTVSYAYDEYGNISQETDGSGSNAGTTTYQFDKDNQLTQQVDPNHSTTITAYDGEGQKTAVTVAAGTSSSAITQYAYDADGHVTSEIDPDTNTTTYEYDDLGLVTLQTGPLGSISTEYDDDGHMTEQTDADGREQDWEYDADSRATLVTWKDGGTTTDTQSFTYDSAGDLTSATNDDGTVSMGYDAEGDMTSQTDVNGVTLTFSDDAAGHQTLITDSMGATESMIYDAAGNLIGAGLQAPGVPFASVNLARDQSGQITTIARTTGLQPTGGSGTSIYTYNSREEVTAITTAETTTGGPAIADSYQYAYDTGGRMTSEVVNGSGTSYQYNEANELTAAGSTTYSYDANGNPTGPGMVVGTDNELTSDGTWSYEYDADGNLTEKSDASTDETWSYTYNNANQMLTATDTVEGTTVSEVAYKYDALGDRTEESVTTSSGTETTKFVTDGQNTWADLNSDGSTTWYLNGDQPDERFAFVQSSGTVSWELTDERGSVLAVTNSSGTVVDNITYDAFGNITSETNAAAGGRMKYDGMQYDAATKLYYDGSRYYSSSMQRFTTQDPTGLGADSDPYRYANNNPTNDWDPSGNSWLSDAWDWVADKFSKAQAEAERQIEKAKETLTTVVGPVVSDTFQKLSAGATALMEAGQKYATVIGNRVIEAGNAVANAASDAWDKAKEWGSQLAKDLAEAAMKLGGPVTELFQKFDELKQYGANAFQMIQTIAADPTKVAGNLIGGGLDGFKRFFNVDDLGSRLQGHLFSWLFGGSIGELPKLTDLSLPSLASAGLQVLKTVSHVDDLTPQYFKGLVGSVTGVDPDDVMHKVALFQQFASGDGDFLGSLATKLDEVKNGVIGTVRDGAISYLVHRAVPTVIAKVVATLVPGAGLATAAVSIYNGVTWAIDNKDKIINFVKGVSQTFTAIVNDGRTAASNQVFGLLNQSVPLLLDLAARQVGAGNLPGTIREIISKLDVRTWIQKGAQALWDKAKSAIGNLVFGPRPLTPKVTFGDPWNLWVAVPKGGYGQIYVQHNSEQAQTLAAWANSAAGQDALGSGAAAIARAADRIQNTCVGPLTDAFQARDQARQRAGSGAATTDPVRNQQGITGLRLDELSKEIKQLLVAQKAATEGGTRACFGAGTPLLVPGGSKPIETFRAGDLVLSRDEFDWFGAVEVKVVEEVFERFGRIVHLHVGDLVIVTTPEHPFWVVDRGDWVPAFEILPRERLIGHDGQSVVVEEVYDTGE